MPAYSFAPRFVEPIIAGTKGGTIRAARRQPRRGQFQRAPDRPGSHARVGEELQLYTGMRTKQCRLIGHRTCIAVEQITLHLALDAISFWDNDRHLITPTELDAFARFDGFGNWRELTAFWSDVPIFDGWHIRWAELPSPLVDSYRKE